MKYSFDGMKNSFDGMTEWRFVVDETCLVNDIQPLRLPPYTCELNPIELLWSLLKRKIRDNESPNSKIDSIIETGHQIICSVDVNICKKFDEHISEKELWFRRIDGCSTHQIDPVIINLEEDDFSSSDDSDFELF